MKPSLNTIEETMRNNIEEIKNKLRSSSISDNNDSLTNEMFKSSSTRRNTDKKFSEIKQIGESLYEKLLEKVYFHNSGKETKRISQIRNSETTEVKIKEITNLLNISIIYPPETSILAPPVYHWTS